MAKKIKTEKEEVKFTNDAILYNTLKKEKRVDYSLTTFRHNRKLYNHFLKTGEVKKHDDIIIVSRFNNVVNSKVSIHHNDLKHQLRIINEDNKIMGVQRKLRDSEGKPIYLRNNRFKVVTEKENDIFPSQYVVEYRFTLKVKGKFISKNVFGYAPMTASYLDADIREKIVYENAVSTFLKSVGHTTGSKNLNIKVKRIRHFWITYVDYGAIINHRLAQIYE